MLYNPPTGGAANDPYVGKNVAAGIQGSKVPPAAVEYPQREIMSVINAAIAAGLQIAPTNGDLTQLLKSIEFLIPKYTPAAAGATVDGGLAVDGSGNFLLSLIANLLADTRGTPVDADSIPLGRAADGAMVRVPASKLAVYVLSNIIATNTFPQILAAPTIFVRSDGNDANNGLTNTPAGAFATIQAAASRGSTIYAIQPGTNLTIQLGAPGTYAAPTTIYGGAGIVNIVGDAGAPSQYIISGANNALDLSGGQFFINGVTLLNQQGGGATLIGDGSFILLNNVAFNTNASSGASQHIFVVRNASIQVGAGCSFSGNMALCLYASNATITLLSNIITLVGNPTFGIFAYARDSGANIILFSGAVFSGSSSGQRYLADLNSVIDASGQGANAFPGTTPGAIQRQGYYAA